MEIKISSNIIKTKMPKITKNQAIRNNAFTLLESIEQKLNKHTYKTLVKNIRNKRIDVVKKLITNFKVLQYSNDKNITKKSLNQNVEAVKEQNITKLQKNIRTIQKRNIIKKSIKITDPYTGSIWAELKQLKEETGSVRLTLVEDGIVIRTFTIDLDKAKNKDIYYNLFHDLDYNSIFDENPEADLIITKEEGISPNRIAQAFKQGTTNCLFKPIIEWCENKIELAQTTGTRKKYISKLNVVKKMELEYHESGVIQDELQKIADDLQINIRIKLPFDAYTINTQSNKKPLTTFEYINTKINHIDGFTHNEIVNKKIEEISNDDMLELYNKLKTNKEYFIFKRHSVGISSISTLTATYILKQEFNEFTTLFKQETGINECSICDFRDFNLSQYVRASNNANLTIDFIKEEEDDNLNSDFPPLTEQQFLNNCVCVYKLYKEREPDIEPDFNKWVENRRLEFIKEGRRFIKEGTVEESLDEEKTDFTYNHMDMEKAYKNVNKCKWFEGYLGKITDFRPTNKIEEIGIYTITNLVLPKTLDDYNNKMKIWKNGNPYPSPELKFLKDMGATFNIIEGCWGFGLNFDFDEPEWLNVIDDSRNKKPTKWYAKFVGCLECYSENESFYINGDKEYLQNLVSYLPTDKYRTYEDEVRFLMKNETNNHYTHIASFIKSYTRINMIQQLLTMDIKDIRRVCVDGIYYKNEYKCCNIFRNDPKPIKNNLDTGTYCSNYYTEKSWNTDNIIPRTFHKNELHTGVGGGGKTHKQLIDSGNCKVKYFAPSWKLARNKEKEYGVKCDVWYNLLTADPEKYGKIKRNYNVLVIDEVSMMTNENKNLLLKRFDNCKIIMCGDIGFQLDAIDPERKYTPFKNEGFEYYETHNTNYRVKCKRLLFLLNKIRKMMTDNCSTQQLKDYALNNFNKIEKIQNYKVEDMILTHTNIQKNLLSQDFEELEKYYILENTRLFSNGDIVYFKPENVKCELRHAFTTHSIQGETALGNLFIDINNIRNKKMIYTALSRAKYHEQIHLLVK